MSSVQSYTLVLNTYGKNVLSADTTHNIVTFNVNWSSFLPMQCVKYSCSYVFKSFITANALVNNGIIYANFGKNDAFVDGSTPSSYLGMICPSLVGTNYFFNSTNNDNNPETIQISNNQLTITLKKFDGTALTGAPNDIQGYCLTLTLTPIYD